MKFVLSFLALDFVDAALDIPASSLVNLQTDKKITPDKKEFEISFEGKKDSYSLMRGKDKKDAKPKKINLPKDDKKPIKVNFSLPTDYALTVTALVKKSENKDMTKVQEVQELLNADLKSGGKLFKDGKEQDFWKFMDNLKDAELILLFRASMGDDLKDGVLMLLVEKDSDFLFWFLIGLVIVVVVGAIVFVVMKKKKASQAETKSV